MSKRLRETRDWFNKYKSKLHCEICYENNPACLEFHHINPDTKYHPVSDLVARGYSKRTILLEVKKCRVLCANCHRILHSKGEVWIYVYIPLKSCSRIACSAP